MFQALGARNVARNGLDLGTFPFSLLLENVPTGIRVNIPADRRHQAQIPSPHYPLASNHLKGSDAPRTRS